MLFYSVNSFFILVPKIVAWMWNFLKQCSIFSQKLWVLVSKIQEGSRICIHAYMSMICYDRFYFLLWLNGCGFLCVTSLFPHLITADLGWESASYYKHLSNIIYWWVCCDNRSVDAVNCKTMVWPTMPTSIDRVKWSTIP